uniref:ARAD1B01232p n=1 Tax=Blastobotrys adeninivorans TaxID=409370 RepID=A0A060T4P7_BLAAD
MVNVGVIVASQRTPRAGESVAKFVLQAIKKSKASATEKRIDLAEWNIPIMSEPVVPKRITSTEGYSNELTRKWSREILSHDAFVMVVPEYNGGYPASIKNAIDHLYNEWTNKPIMLVTYGGGGGHSVAQQLTTVLAHMKMRPLGYVRLGLPRESILDPGATVDSTTWAAQESSIVDLYSQLVAAAS